jgi:hypothetical protein
MALRQLGVQVTDGDKLTPKDAYKIALDTRNFEIGLFWQRSNYFLVLNTALAVGFFKVDEIVYSLLLAALGVIVSFLWYRVNLGSKFWQSRWEERLKIAEVEVAPDLKFFAADWETIHADVKSSLEHGRHTGIQKFLRTQILKKCSVSHQMTTLSIVFIAAWTFVLAAQIVRII